MRHEYVISYDGKYPLAPPPAIVGASPCLLNAERGKKWFTKNLIGDGK